MIALDRQHLSAMRESGPFIKDPSIPVSLLRKEPSVPVAYVPRHPSPNRTASSVIEYRREIHLSTQSLSKAAGATRDALALEKQLTALQKLFSATDEQLASCKTELRNSKRDNERLLLEHEEMQRRVHSALAERASATKQLAEIKDEYSKLDRFSLSLSLSNILSLSLHLHLSLSHYV
jgi:regulator of replication initiation timing